MTTDPRDTSAPSLGFAAGTIAVWLAVLLMPCLLHLLLEFVFGR